MAYSRRLGADDGCFLMACSICGFAYRYPSELRYCNDRLFRCLRTCNDPHTPVDYARIEGQRKTQEEIAPRGPMGVPPDWYE